nr:proofreading thioesterase EntH [Klebsiella quasipneumoniae]
MAWKRALTLAALNASSENTLVAHLGIVYTRLEAGLLEAEMPVDARTHQPFGLLHGGASAALAETLGSMAGWLMTEEGQCVVGTELNATHHRAVSSGKVRGECRPLHLGRQSQSWEIVVYDEKGRRCACAGLRSAPAFRECLCDVETANTGSFSQHRCRCRPGQRSATRQNHGVTGPIRSSTGNPHNPFIHFPALSDLASNVRQISVGGRHLRCFDVVKFCVVI